MSEWDIDSIVERAARDYANERHNLRGQEYEWDFERTKAQMKAALRPELEYSVGYPEDGVYDNDEAPLFDTLAGAEAELRSRGSYRHDDVVVARTVAGAWRPAVYVSLPSNQM